MNALTSPESDRTANGQLQSGPWRLLGQQSEGSAQCGSGQPFAVVRRPRHRIPLCENPVTVGISILSYLLLSRMTRLSFTARVQRRLFLPVPFC